MLSFQKNRKIGLALGGGGARGIAHLGVLRALTNAGIEISAFAGTSMGAMIAVGIVQANDFSRSVKHMKEFVLKYGEQFTQMTYLQSHIDQNMGVLGEIVYAVTSKLQLLSVIKKKATEDGTLLEEIVNHFVYPCNLEELSTPLYIATLDIVTGRGVLINGGDARNAVRASMSIGGYFPCVKFKKMELLDPQAVFPIPIHAFMAEEVDLIIASSVDKTISQDFHAENAADILFRQQDIAFGHAFSEIEHCSDVVIQVQLDDVHWTDFHKMDLIIKRGLRAGKEAVPKIKELLKKRKLRKKPSRPWHSGGYGNLDRILITKFPPVNAKEKAYE